MPAEKEFIAIVADLDEGNVNHRQLKQAACH